MTTQTAVDKLLTMKQVARRRRVTVQRIQQLISEGKLSAERFGRAVRIRESALRRYEQTHVPPDALPATNGNATATESETR